MKSVCLCVCLIGMASVASAQVPTSYTLKVFNQGAPQPIATSALPTSAFVCNQTAPDTTNTANPNKVLFNDPDPANPGKVCIFIDGGSGPLLSLPFGSGIYVATIAAVNTAGPSPDSALSNLFSRPGATAVAPVGLKVYR